MNYGYDPSQPGYPRADGIPSGSRLAQYMQAGAAASNSSNNAAASNSYQNYLYVDSQTGIGAEATTQISYPFSQMNIAGPRQQSNTEIDSVSAYLNSDYAGQQGYYQNVDGFNPEYDEQEEDAYYMYQSQPIRVWKNRLKSHPRSTFFIDPNIKAELISRQLLLQSSGPPTDAIYPDSAEGYENLTQLSRVAAPSMMPAAGHCMPDTVYRAVKAADGQTYCLRRVSTTKPLTQKQITNCENWKRIVHSNIVQLREVIPTQAFNDFSYVFVYDFHPSAQTMETHFFGKASTEHSCIESHLLPVGQTYGGISEMLIWAFVIQLSSAIRFVHLSGMAIRFLNLSRVLIHGKSKSGVKVETDFRVMLNCVGIGDMQVVENGGKANIVVQQIEDLRNFADMIIVLAVGKRNAATPENLHNSFIHLEQHFSADLKNLVHAMRVSKMGSHNLTSINEIMPMIGARFYGHIESLQMKIDYLEDELAKEMENGRLLRVLCKLNTVNERVDQNVDETWSETGDRYLLKLFRDYIFHQVSANGKPWIDLSHICMCLNKIDAGVNENIQLTSRDGENVLIVSYGELRRCLENSFTALISPQFSVSAPVPGAIHRPSASLPPMMGGMAGGSELAVKPPGGLFVPSQILGPDVMMANAQLAYSAPPVAPKPKRPLQITNASTGGDEKQTEKPGA